MDFITILSLIVASMLKYSAPLIFTSIGGTFSERGGIVNVGLEGIMVIGAFVGVLFNLNFADSFGNATPWIAALVAGFIGLLYSLLHAAATVNFRADHVVSGTVLDLIAPPLAVFLTRVIYGAGQTPAISHNFKTVSFPILSNIPVLGKIFFTNVSLIAYVAILVSVVSWWIIFKTRFGLRLRSVGEHPQAADTLGINVYRMRYYGVMISGFLWWCRWCGLRPIDFKQFCCYHYCWSWFHCFGRYDFWSLESSWSYALKFVLRFVTIIGNHRKTVTCYFTCTKRLFANCTVYFDNYCFSCILR